MARPNVTVIVNDESFVISGSEAGGAHRAGYLSAMGKTLVDALGYTADRTRNYMVVESVTDWINRLRSTAPTGYASVYGATGSYEGPFGGLSGGQQQSGNLYAGGTLERWPLGPTAEWRQDWWNVHNYLQYGGTAIVGASAATEVASKALLLQKSIQLDSVFGPTAANSNVSAVATTRGDCVAVVGIDSGTAPSAAAVVTASENVIHVYGEKLHRDIARISTSAVADENLVTSSLVADVAGCLARTDRVANPWFSPGGVRRGQILDVVRLARELSDGDQDTLYDNKINPVVSFPGEGTILFGDKTGAASTSTLSRINVARLFIYLKNIIGTAARTILFELNDSTTRNLFINAVTPVLRNIQGQRGITDFRVVCDETNNTADIIDSNQFVADIFIKPTKSVNFVRIRFTNKSESADLG